MRKLTDPLPTFANFLARHSAIIALAVFAVVGVAILDDYGIASDEIAQRGGGHASLDYVLGDEDALLEGYVERYYGVAFEVPLAAAERLLRLEDYRAIYLSRHLITHLFFLVGGFFCWLLTYRLFGSRLVALIAMLLFLLHPRLYAHSFFNSKDIPFLSMFIIALYLTHRAFRRDTARAFALCGVGVGLLVAVRIMGLTLIPAVLGMLALDAFHAMRREGRTGARRALANAGAFCLASAATIYAAWPLLWRDPSELITALRLTASHPVANATLFRGEFVQWPNIPWDYIPAWALITTPPVALALAALGTARLASLCAGDWRGALSNSTARFGLLAAACALLPVVAAISLNSNLYNGWRHLYFIYAPICVLVAFGLRWISSLPKPGFRAAAYALAAVGIALAVVQMALIHPYQNDYFNPLADKSALAERWKMDYWYVSRKEALETILKTQPTERVLVWDGVTRRNVESNMRLIPPDERRRLSVNPNFPSFRIVSGDGGDDGGEVVWRRGVYGAPIVSVIDSRAESEAAFRENLAAARASTPLANGGGFGIYRDGDTLIYAKENCGEEDALGTFQLSIIPSDRADLPGRLRKAGLAYETSRFDFWSYGATLGGDCVIVRELPDYPIHALETERWIDATEGATWRATIQLGESLTEYAAALSAPPGERKASGGGFDMYADGDTLVYIKKSCDDDDARGRFFLSAFPVDQDDLPQSARDAGSDHEPLNFDFRRHGAALDGKCVIIRYLPDYPISHLQTGQWIPGEGELWSAKIPLAGYHERYRRALSALSGEPSARSDFTVWLNGGGLTYVKEGCGEEDARGRFALSVFPVDQNDLPQSARDAGFDHEPLNFDFHRYGAIFDGKCVIIRDLPDYPIRRIETGQWLPGEGELWRVEIGVGG